MNENTVGRRTALAEQSARKQSEKMFETARMEDLAVLDKRRWWEKNTEIDIVAADYERLHCLVGECKYRNEKVGLKVFRSLQAKCVHLPVHEDAVFHYWLFSRSGFEDSVKELAERDPYLHLVGMEELLD